MRIHSILTIVAVMGLFVAQAQAEHKHTPSANAATGPSPEQADSQVQQYLKQVDAYAERQQQILEHRLKQAEALRAKGLQTENGALLRQAEQLEQQAFAEYAKSIAKLDPNSSNQQPTPASPNPGAKSSRRNTTNAPSSRSGERSPRAGQRYPSNRSTRYYRNYTPRR